MMLPPSAKYILAALPTCPTVPQIIRQTGYGRTTVIRTLRKLLEAGLVTREMDRRPPGHKGAPLHRYTLTAAALHVAQATPTTEAA